MYGWWSDDEPDVNVVTIYARRQASTKIIHKAFKPVNEYLPRRSLKKNGLSVHDPEQFGNAPRLSWTAARPVRSVAVKDLRDLAETRDRELRGR